MQIYFQEDSQEKEQVFWRFVFQSIVKTLNN
jgi:hypothetical protein